MSKPSWKPPRHVELMRKHQEEKDLAEYIIANKIMKNGFPDLPKLLEELEKSLEIFAEQVVKIIETMPGVLQAVAEMLQRHVYQLESAITLDRMRREINMSENLFHADAEKIQDIIRNAEKVNAEINELSAKIDAEQNPAEVARLTKEYWNKQDEYGALWNAYCIAVGVMGREEEDKENENLR